MMAQISESCTVGALPSGDEFLRMNAVNIGNLKILDTYLSQNEYRGLSIGYSRWSSKYKETFLPIFNYKDSYLKTDVSSLTDHNGNGSFLAWTFDYKYAWSQLLYNDKRFSLLAGPAVLIKLGAEYNMQNSNNPVQVKFLTSLAAHGKGIYRFKICDFPLSASYQLFASLVGVTFAPEYGQLYYEMSEYNQYSKAIRFAWPLSCFSMNQIISVDIPVMKNQIRLSYSYDIYDYSYSKLDNNIASSIFSVGIIHKFENKYNGR